MEKEALRKIYDDAEIAMKKGEWKKGRDLALELIKADPDYIEGWTLLFIYEVREGVLGKTNSLEKFEIDDIPFEILEQQATQKKVLSFKSSFIEHLKKEYNIDD
ncbi:MAG: hypothetical protein BAJALOKI3v1_1070003 [Promethearchaeota archaeon]|jgi:hypothetical protein|nr:MAG: hypothetical protein BAJALOKI3v1_1070003 [Candidatus Lokiarchaeota archaeon]